MGVIEMRNYVLIVDKSGSMGDPVKRGSSTSRWDAVKEYAETFARECSKLDPDGIDLYFFNQRFTRFENATSDQVRDAFSRNAPMGGTDFVPVLTDAIDRHFAGDRPTTILIITDGDPSDGVQGQRALANLIIDTTKKMEADAELALSFIQIGEDLAATQFLKKLDDELESVGAKFDIVDTKTCDDLNNMTIQDVLLAAIND